MSAADTARNNYSAVRAEIVQRMQLRDYVLLVFLGFTGAIFSVAFGSSNRIAVLLALPYLSLGAAILVSQHNMMAAILGEFLSRELQTALAEEKAPHWDNSSTFHAFAKTAADFRFIGHILIIFVPCIVALGVNWRAAFYASFPDNPMWWFGALCLLMAGFVIWYSHNKRMQLYINRPWQQQSGGAADNGVSAISANR